MKFAVRFILVLLAAINVQSAVINPLAISDPSINIGPDTDPLVAAQCFNLYLPLLTEIANTFSTQYQACINAANDQITLLTTQAEQNQTFFIQQTDAICSGFQSCANDTEVLDFFNCYSSVLSEDVTTVYDVAAQSSAAAITLSGGLRSIQDNEYQCTNATERTYVTDTANTYALLNTCFLSGMPNAASTTAAAPPMTTDAPEGSTADDNETTAAVV